jgi:aryl-alcohol dehydrogenase-like predicted oxidoreductase
MRKPPQACGACGGGELLTERDLDRIVFGCGNFGGIGSSPSLRAAGDGEEQALLLLDHARLLGPWRFDTANTYGGGLTTEIPGTQSVARTSGLLPPRQPTVTCIGS